MKVSQIEKYFQQALSSELLRFEVKDDWLVVEFKENLGATYKDGARWSLVCAQKISDYRSPVQLCNRITAMLAENLRSNRQDVNILMNDRREK